MENSLNGGSTINTVSGTICKSPEALLPESKVLKRFSPFWRQIFAASGSLLCAVSCGLTVGYSAILLPQLRDREKFNFTLEEESWIASMATLPMAPGCLIGGIVMHIFGRKFLNIFVGLPFFIGWALTYFANGFIIFMCGRFLQGISLGIIGPLNSVFIGETSDPKLRGMLLASVSLGYAFGIVVVHALGTFLPWRTTALLCGSVNILSSLIFCFIPESPSYLLSKGRVDSAYRAFIWLRGCGSEAIAEFQSMVSSQTSTPASTEKQPDKIGTKLLKTIIQPEFYKPLAILIGLFFVLQFIGINAIVFYTISIMKKAIGDGVNEYTAMLTVDGVRFGIGIIACILIKHVNRRPLCTISGYGAGICLLAVSVFLYTSSKWPELQEYSAVSLVLIIGYICFSGLGLMPLPWCLIGELFPLRYRGIGSGIASASNFIFFFTVVKTAPFMFAWIEIEGTFLIYGTISIVGTFVLSIYLPETMNKTLQEIEDEFTGKDNINNKDIIKDNVKNGNVNCNVKIKV